MNNLINQTLEALKSRLNADGKLKSQRMYGYSFDCTFKFYKPATDEEMNSFEEALGFTLPGDYRELLKIHNGIELFIEDKEYFTPHWYIFSIEEIEEHLEKQLAPAHLYPIAKHHTTLVYLDNNQIKNGQKDCIVIRNFYDSEEEHGDPLTLNFELWFDMLIVAQGVEFWVWPSLTPEIYEKT